MLASRVAPAKHKDDILRSYAAAIASVTCGPAHGRTQNLSLSVSESSEPLWRASMSSSPNALPPPGACGSPKSSMFRSPAPLSMSVDRARFQSRSMSRCDGYS